MVASKKVRPPKKKAQTTQGAQELCGSCLSQELCTKCDQPATRQYMCTGSACGELYPACDRCDLNEEVKKEAKQKSQDRQRKPSIFARGSCMDKHKNQKLWFVHTRIVLKLVEPAAPADEAAEAEATEEPMAEEAEAEATEEPMAEEPAAEEAEAADEPTAEEAEATEEAPVRAPRAAQQQPPPAGAPAAASARRCAGCPAGCPAAPPCGVQPSDNDSGVRLPPTTAGSPPTQSDWATGVARCAVVGALPPRQAVLSGPGSPLGSAAGARAGGQAIDDDVQQGTLATCGGSDGGAAMPAATVPGGAACGLPVQTKNALLQVAAPEDAQPAMCCSASAPVLPAHAAEDPHALDAERRMLLAELKELKKEEWMLEAERDFDYLCSRVREVHGEDRLQRLTTVHRSFYYYYYGDASPETWGTQEVGQWLLRVGVREECDLRQYVEMFDENEVSGRVLQVLQSEESDEGSLTGMLAVLGVELGHRKLIQDAVQDLFARDA